jgi:hypothetical protein
MRLIKLIRRIPEREVIEAALSALALFHPDKNQQVVLIISTDTRSQCLTLVMEVKETEETEPEETKNNT